MQLILIILRLTHIVAGAFWVGSALMMALIVIPALRNAGPGSERNLPMAQISRSLSIASGLTTVAGLLLFWWASRFAWGWIISPLGIGLTLGALAGIAAFLMGSFSTGPTAKKIGALAAQMQVTGGPPSQEQMAEMGRLRAKLGTSSKWSTILATVSLAFMAIARYL
jgi:hypothetical protein